jgi:DNA-binding response OmpR family regulator
MVNVLIFSDQNKYLNNLVTFLTNNECQVEVLSGITLDIKLDLICKFEAVFVDLEMKSSNGYAILNKIRELDMVIPVLVVSSKNDLSEKLFAYKLGADDYISKSNSFEEGLIKMQILIKKIDLNKFGISNEIIINDLRINVKTLTVYRNNVQIDLTKKEFLLLKTLADSRGQVINKSELMNKLWHGKDKTRENVVEVCMNSLRKKIDNNFGTKIIHTKIGMGYYLS